MASDNSTNFAASNLPTKGSPLPVTIVQVEKISCSLPDFSSLEPSILLGHVAHFADMQPFPLGGNRFYDALVTAVSLGSDTLGTSSHLQLRIVGTDYEEFVSVSDLHLVSFETPAQA